jgi:hypothetical protein
MAVRGAPVLAAAELISEKPLTIMIPTHHDGELKFLSPSVVVEVEVTMVNPPVPVLPAALVDVIFLGVLNYSLDSVITIFSV